MSITQDYHAENSLKMTSALQDRDHDPLKAARKVVCIASFMNSGGAQEAILRLARQLRARGHETEVWFLYEVAAIHHGPHVRVLCPKAALGLFGYLQCFMLLLRELRVAKPDALIGFLPLGNVFGMIAGSVSGIPVRIASQRSPGTTYGRHMRKLDRVCGMTRIFTHIVCVSNAVKDSFSTYPSTYRRKLSVAHNGIEWEASPLIRADARAELELAADAFIVSAAGRLEDQKNYPFLLEVVAAVDKVQLVIAGEGSLRDQLVSQARDLGINDRLVLLGHLSRQSMRHLLRASDAFIQPSKFEGQSNSLLEAMHEGLPILVSDIPEQRETVVDETSGEQAALLAPLGDLDTWRTRLAQLRDDAAMRKDLSARAKQMVNRRFSLQRMTDRFESVLLGRALQP